jgi:hypothetical protein
MARLYEIEFQERHGIEERGSQEFDHLPLLTGNAISVNRCSYHAYTAADSLRASPSGGTPTICSFGGPTGSEATNCHRARSRTEQGNLKTSGGQAGELGQPGGAE